MGVLHRDARTVEHEPINGFIKYVGKLLASVEIFFHIHCSVLYCITDYCCVK